MLATVPVCVRCWGPDTRTRTHVARLVSPPSDLCRLFLLHPCIPGLGAQGYMVKTLYIECNVRFHWGIKKITSNITPLNNTPPFYIISMNQDESMSFFFFFFSWCCYGAQIDFEMRSSFPSCSSARIWAINYQILAWLKIWEQLNWLVLTQGCSWGCSQDEVR